MMLDKEYYIVTGSSSGLGENVVSNMKTLGFNTVGIDIVDGEGTDVKIDLSTLSKDNIDEIKQYLGGAKIKSINSGNLPLKINKSDSLQAIEYELPIASAQIKSCILFAGLYSEGLTIVREKDITRNHTEIMFKQFGVPLTVHQAE